jgi:hypothetical protein
MLNRVNAIRAKRIARFEVVLDPPHTINDSGNSCSAARQV